jgi:signal transduction histidine kinase
MLQFKSERIAIKPILENCCKVMQLNAHMKNIRIHIVTQDSLYAHADKEMIEFAVRNLLSNAVKFSHRDSDVFMKASIVDDRIKIQVLDSGVGMNQNTIQKLAASNINTSRRGTEKEKGTGLGLLISKDFIEKNGSQLFVQSEVGKGTTFSFDLPIDSYVVCHQNSTR